MEQLFIYSMTWNIYRYIKYENWKFFKNILVGVHQKSAQWCQVRAVKIKQVSVDKIYVNNNYISPADYFACLGLSSGG